MNWIRVNRAMNAAATLLLITTSTVGLADETFSCPMEGEMTVTPPPVEISAQFSQLETLIRRNRAPAELFTTDYLGRLIATNNAKISDGVVRLSILDDPERVILDTFVLSAGKLGRSEQVTVLVCWEQTGYVGLETLIFDTSRTTEGDIKISHIMR